jgi:hypothetical protein
MVVRKRRGDGAESQARTLTVTWTLKAVACHVEALLAVRIRASDYGTSVSDPSQRQRRFSSH